jgi:hypothetical protein
VLREVANRWDAVELWVTQLAFPFQVVLAVLVVLPLCWALAGLLDRAVDAAVLLSARRRPTLTGRTGRVSRRPRRPGRGPRG